MESRSNYQGYYISVQGVPFRKITREGLKIAPALEQVGDSYVLASGYLNVKLIPHARRKIWLSIPYLTQDEYRQYWNALHSDATGKGMKLSIQYYDDLTDTYITDDYYHTDLMVTPVFIGGQWMYKFDDFELIGY